MGPFKVIYDGRGGIPALCWSLKEDMNSGFTLYDLADRLRSRGWQVPAYSMPANREDLVIQRILCVMVSAGISAICSWAICVAASNISRKILSPRRLPRKRRAGIGTLSITPESFINP